MKQHQARDSLLNLRRRTVNVRRLERAPKHHQGLLPESKDYMLFLIVFCVSSWLDIVSRRSKLPPRERKTAVEQKWHM